MTAQNLEYARTVLTQLERDTLGIKAPSRRSEVQGTLNQHRELLELLFDRLEDIRKVCEAWYKWLLRLTA